jgi:predicted esterase
MRRERRKIPRPQCGQEAIASMLLLIWIHGTGRTRSR